MVDDLAEERADRLGGSAQGRRRRLTLKPRRPKVLSANLWLIGPLFVGVLLNAVIRPVMADRLGGEQVVTGAGVRGRDVHWVFDAPTQGEHPLATVFLGWSHGQIALVALAAAVVLGLGEWSIGLLRRRGKG
ncbi:MULTISPECIES: hypothetical protein [unclassified Brevundimonas]|uniref:hypothetical protein n=1 Tax=unclassified Brevundimonas TaxID=2622653 RepID=UPI000E8116EB|nr:MULTISPECIES: hypothetical protein [unclassified Brevundimonas]MCK6104656.1 hypothetical protein [Brevundimonas sp. EYE_349]HBI20008.1 hypothetical protein [Brevundimonas sp.]